MRFSPGGDEPRHPPIRQARPAEEVIVDLKEGRLRPQQSDTAATCRAGRRRRCAGYPELVCQRALGFSSPKLTTSIWPSVAPERRIIRCTASARLGEVVVAAAALVAGPRPLRARDVLAKVAGVRLDRRPELQLEQSVVEPDAGQDLEPPARLPAKACADRADSCVADPSLPAAPRAEPGAARRGVGPPRKKRRPRPTEKLQRGQSRFCLAETFHWVGSPEVAVWRHDPRRRLKA